jgi:hypothetical protein
VAKATAVSKPKVVKGLVEVVVDRLRYADDAQALLVQGVGDGQRAVTADRHQGIDLLARKELENLAGKVHVLGRAVRHLHREMQGIPLVGGAQDGAAQVSDAAHLLARQAVTNHRLDNAPER